MLTPLNKLNQKFSNLENEVKNGKILSTSLKADSPNLAKLRFLSFITLGIYYAVYQYQHNPERVFTKITGEIKKTMKDFKMKPEKIESLTLSERKRLEITNQKLQKIKKELENENREIKSDEFVDQIFFTMNNHDCENEALELLKGLIKNKIPSDTVHESIYNEMLKKYENKSSSLTLEEQIAYTQLKKIKPDQIKLKINCDTKKIEGKLEFRLTFVDSTTTIKLNASLDMPSVKNHEIIDSIDKMISSNNEKLAPDNDKKIKEEFSKNIEEQKKNLNEIFAHASALTNEIWKKNKTTKDVEKNAAEIIELYRIKTLFLQKFEEESQPVLNEWEPFNNNKWDSL